MGFACAEFADTIVRVLWEVYGIVWLLLGCYWWLLGGFLTQALPYVSMNTIHFILRELKIQVKYFERNTRLLFSTNHIFEIPFRFEAQTVQDELRIKV